MFRRTRAQSISILQPTTSRVCSSQPVPIVVQPSPKVTRTRRALTQPISTSTTSGNCSMHEQNAEQNPNEVLTCPICTIDVTNDSSEKALMCDHCQTWYHSECLFITDDEYSDLSNSSENWYCDRCRSIQANRIKWGNIEGEANISNAIKAAYKEMIGWKKNIFSLPRGKCGSDFLKELTRLIYLFVDRTKWERLALPLIHIFVPLMLQKPSKKSKAKDHAKYLASRLGKWARGELDNLLTECNEIQKRLLHKKAVKAESKMKSFCRLMLIGKVGQASKFINNNDCIS